MIFLESPPKSFIASLIEARSTTHGTPVKSYKTTLDGLKGISMDFGAFSSQDKMFSTSCFLIENSSQFLMAASSKILIE